MNATIPVLAPLNIHSRNIMNNRYLRNDGTSINESLSAAMEKKFFIELKSKVRNPGFTSIEEANVSGKSFAKSSDILSLIYAVTRTDAISTIPKNKIF
jgi:hypothetical protein